MDLGPVTGQIFSATVPPWLLSNLVDDFCAGQWQFRWMPTRTNAASILGAISRTPKGELDRAELNRLVESGAFIEKRTFVFYDGEPIDLRGADYPTIRECRFIWRGSPPKRPPHLVLLGGPAHLEVGNEYVLEDTATGQCDTLRS